MHTHTHTNICSSNACTSLRLWAIPCCEVLYICVSKCCHGLRNCRERNNGKVGIRRCFKPRATERGADTARGCGKQNKSVLKSGSRQGLNALTLIGWRRKLWREHNLHCAGCCKERLYTSKAITAKGGKRHLKANLAATHTITHMHTHTHAHAQSYSHARRITGKRGQGKGRRPEKKKSAKQGSHANCFEQTW